MELSNIKNFLEEYRKRIGIFDEERKQICEAIFRASGISLSESQITTKRGVLEIKTDSVTRAEIFLYKTRILEELQKATSKKIAEIT